MKHQYLENTRAEVERTARWIQDVGTHLRHRDTELSEERARLLARREDLPRG
ncbi:hypothetical protein [Nonomuraea jabiensis]|uniref:hypothetical protein n=1 Tax=Nonomuraea jabiensis TaxID=882448 RepID=UPI0036B93F54